MKLGAFPSLNSIVELLAQDEETFKERKITAMKNVLPID
jgi:hypothetical protein